MPQQLPQTVMEAVDRGYTLMADEQAAEWQGEDPDLIHVSEIKDCRRRVVMNRLKVPITNPRSRQESQLMDVGKAFHKKLDQWASTGTTVIAYDDEENPFSISDELMTGHPDNIMHLQRGLTLVDWKSIRPGGFIRIVKSGKPYDDHILQGNTYLGMLGLRFGVIVYINRETGEQREYAFEFNPTLYAQARIDAKNLLKLIHHAQKTGEIPDVEQGFKHDGFPCWYPVKDNSSGVFCQFWDHCWGGERLNRVEVETMANQPSAKPTASPTKSSEGSPRPEALRDDTIPAPGVLMP